MVYKELSDKGTLKIFKEIDLHRKNIKKNKNNLRSDVCQKTRYQ